MARIVDQRPSTPAGMFSQLMSTVGDGSGTSEMIDATGTYKITPPAGKRYHIHRLNVYIEEGQNEKFDAALYGSTSALNTGIVVTAEDSTAVLHAFTPDDGIKKIGEWSLVAGVDMDFTDFPSGASDYCAVRWTLAKHGGPVTLDGDLNQELKMSVLSSLGTGGALLVSHRVQAQGTQENT